MPRADGNERDRQLLRQLAEGQQKALAELYDLHAASLFRHALALSRRRAEAEDLVHAVFVKIAGLGADLLGVRRPAGYLHRMLHTAWIDTCRHTKVADYAVDDLNVDSVYVPSHDAVVDVTRALDSLPVEQRQVVVLHAIEGFAFREIGRLTGVSLFTAAARYRLAAAKLRSTLARERR